jgi:hypothetical protein
MRERAVVERAALEGVVDACVEFAPKVTTNQSGRQPSVKTVGHHPAERKGNSTFPLTKPHVRREAPSA